MPHPYTPDWHQQQDGLERVWLDAWLRGLINPRTLQPHTADVALGPVLTLTGSSR